jgi:hypothetical protein
MGKPSILKLVLDDPNELFVGPTAGTRHVDSPRSVDDVGATLGQSGIERLMQMDSMHATDLVIRLRRATQPSPDLIAQLRAWCECRVDANERIIRTTRRRGRRAMVFALSALAVALAVAWLVQTEAIFGPPGAMRNLLGEAMVIAGWVAMWRPVEMLLFDNVPPNRDNAHLRRLLALPWHLEPPGRWQNDSGTVADVALTQASAASGSESHPGPR